MGYFDLTGQELRPSIEYKGQKLMKLLATNARLMPSKTIPSVPLKTFANTSPEITKATTILMVRSIDPTFFFIGRIV